MALRAVWAFKRIADLDYKVGYINCDPELAQRLIDAGEVQDARRYGLEQKAIDYTDPRTIAPPPTEDEPPKKRSHEYDNKELTTKSKTAHSKKENK